jgi:hypothetical protein
MRCPSPQLLAFVALGALLAPRAAGAEAVLFHVDPAQSWVRVQDGSELGLYLGPLGVVPSWPLVSQLGRIGGASASAQPGLPGPADGRATRIRGRVFAFLTPDAATPTNILISPLATMLVPLPSGTWWPPAFEPPDPNDPEPPPPPTTPAPAQLAFTTESALPGLQATIALRDVALQLRLGRPLVDQGGGRRGFSGAVTAHGQGGVIDVEALGAAGRGGFRKAGFYLGAVSGGLLEDLGPGGLRLTVPFTFDVPLRADLVGGLPARGNLALQGRIVATTVPVPEAGGAGPALAAAAVLGALVRRRARGARR